MQEQAARRLVAVQHPATFNPQQDPLPLRPILLKNTNMPPTEEVTEYEREMEITITTSNVDTKEVCVCVFWLQVCMIMPHGSVRSCCVSRSPPP